jgi:O-antigen/teichoic acid export membrane protein
MRFRNLYITIFILNIIAAINIVVQILFVHRTELSILYVYLSCFVIILLSSFYIYVKALLEFNKIFSKVKLVLLFLFLYMPLVLIYYFDPGILLFFLPILIALFLYVELSILLSIFKTDFLKKFSPFK